MNLTEKTVSNRKAFCVLSQCLIRFLAVATYFPSTSGCYRREVSSNYDDPYSMRFDSTTADVATEKHSHRLDCFPQEQEYAGCLNGGSCFVVKLHANSRFVQCSCTADWSGERCDHRYVDPDLWELGEGKTDAFQLAVVIAFAVASLLLLAILIFVVVFLFRRRKRRLERSRRPNTEEKHKKEDFELTAAGSASKSHIDTESHRTITVYPISSV